MRTAVLAVSFGTTHLDALRADIVPVEEALADAFPGCPVYRAFTSGVVRRRLRERQNMHVDSVEEALARIRSDGMGRVVVQPTLLLPGEEYDGLCAALTAADGLEVRRPPAFVRRGRPGRRDRRPAAGLSGGGGYGLAADGARHRPCGQRPL